MVVMKTLPGFKSPIKDTIQPIYPIKKINLKNNTLKKTLPGYPSPIAPVRPGTKFKKMII